MLSIHCEVASILNSKDSVWFCFPRQTPDSRVPERGKRKAKPMEAIFLKDWLGLGTLRIRESHESRKEYNSYCWTLGVFVFRQDSLQLAVWWRMILNSWSSYFHFQSAAITRPTSCLGLLSSKCVWKPSTCLCGFHKNVSFKCDLVSASYKSQCFSINYQQQTESHMGILLQLATSPQPPPCSHLPTATSPQPRPTLALRKERIAIVLWGEASSFHPVSHCWEENRLWCYHRLQVTTWWLSCIL